MDNSKEILEYLKEIAHYLENLDGTSSDVSDIKLKLRNIENTLDNISRRIR